MIGPIRADNRRTRLIAVAAAAIVAIGLVSAPSTVDRAVPRPPAIPLQTLAVELTSAAHVTAEKTPAANASGPTPQNLAEAAITIALTPLWYAAFPVTLTGSVAFAWILYFYASGVGGWQKPIDTAAVLELGLATYLVGPLTYIQGKLQALVPKSKSASAAAPAKATQTPRKNHGTRGLAGSPRTASQTPAAHHNAKTPPTHTKAKKRTGTAGSARGASNGAQS